ncbi:MAG: GTPase HflX [Erysipelotrichales bacterium]|nr:GTPase HflX [Erysipelotrichales bacterium]
MEKVIVVGVRLEDDVNFDDSIEELKNLCQACNYDVVGEIFQNLKKIVTSTFVGEGKVEEIKNLAKELEVQKLIFNDDLTPSQIRNLQKATKCQILDRSGLIIEIFSSRAKTKEAKIQVEIATLNYLLPKLVSSDANLSQQTGGAGSKNKGLGEKQIDLDKRKIRNSVAVLKKELEKVVTERNNRRAKRNKSEIPSIAIVGYTNAGKSTLLNYFVNRYGFKQDKNVFEKDMLFATLDTSIRKIIFDDNKKVLMSDTVGFVSKLPHDLINAFRSTLEEAKEADLLLNVVDLSNKNYQMQIDVTNDTLKHIGVEDVPIINVFNKIDKISSVETKNDKVNVYISAHNGEGIEDLVSLIKEYLFKNNKRYSLLIPYTSSKVFSYLKEEANVISFEEKDNGILVEIDSSLEIYGKVKQFDINKN